MKSSLCRCMRPERVVDADEVAFCEACGELLPDTRDEILGFLVKEVVALRGQVKRLTPSDTGSLVGVDEMARRLGVHPSYIYSHADELGAIRLPSGGDRGRLRFDPLDVIRRHRVNGNGKTLAETSSPKPNGRRMPATRVPLLPIGGGSTKGTR